MSAAVNVELEHIWSRVKYQLSLVVDEATYDIWLSGLAPLELQGVHLTLSAPQQTCRWIAGRFNGAIQASVELVLGPTASVEVQPVGAPRERSGRSRAPQPPPTPSAGPGGNPRLTFDQFVIGDSNRLAHAAALTVAEMPAQAYSAIFICGPAGVGKSHLLNSIANLLVLHNPTLSVRTTTGEAFTNEFLGALTGRNTEPFKARFRDVDVLLVDDVQFLERKARTEEEFFHTFNALYDSGRQLVLSSDRPPRDLQALEDRLRERFEAGLVADIGAPDLSTRMAILRKRVHDDHIELADEDVLSTIAAHITTNVRSLEGALIRTVAYSSLTGRALTSALAREVLSSLYPAAPMPGLRASNISEIQQATCEHFGISSEELLSSGRSARVAWPRQVAMYLARELTDASLPAIGREFGGRDHTTVLHACRRATERLGTDAASRKAVEKLCDLLSTSPPAHTNKPADRSA